MGIKTLEQLETIYMDGCMDDISGDVEAPTGHFYRVGKQIVTTDSQGFRSVDNFTSLTEARTEFERRNNEYNEWDDDDMDSED